MRLLQNDVQLLHSLFPNTLYTRMCTTQKWIPNVSTVPPYEHPRIQKYKWQTTCMALITGVDEDEASFSQQLRCGTSKSVSLFEGTSVLNSQNMCCQTPQ